mgnify:CR=1 FL=1
MSKTKLQTSMEVLEAAFKSGTFDPAYTLDVMTRADISENVAKAAKKRIQSLLQAHFEQTVSKLYKEKNSDTGTVSEYVGLVHELSIERKKKVEWDQETLLNLVNIKSPVASFIEKKYNVPEKNYNKMNDDQKEALDTGRIVKVGSPVFTIKERRSNGAS